MLRHITVQGPHIGPACFKQTYILWSISTEPLINACLNQVTTTRNWPWFMWPQCPQVITYLYHDDTSHSGTLHQPTILSDPPILSVHFWSLMAFANRKGVIRKYKLVIICILHQSFTRWTFCRWNRNFQLACTGNFLAWVNLCFELRNSFGDNFKHHWKCETVYYKPHTYTHTKF